MHCNPLWSTLQSLDIDAPADLKARDVTTDSSVLTWIPPLADIDGYILTYREEDGNMQVCRHWKLFLYAWELCHSSAVEFFVSQSVQHAYRLVRVHLHAAHL